MKLKEYLQEMKASDKLILLTLLLFVFTKLLVYTGNVQEQQLNQWLCVPSNIYMLWQRPWVLFSYAFYHISFEHLLGNMLFLFLIGRIFFRIYKLKDFLLVYFLGLLVVAFTFLLISYLFPEWVNNTMLLGASAAIMALFSFLVTLMPNYGVYLFTYRVKILYVLLFVFLIDLINFSSNSGGKIAHLGGVSTGVIVGLLYKYLFAFQKRKKQDSNVIPKDSQSHFEEEQRIKQHKVKQLLDKISASGYASLTDVEKKYLFEVSKEI